jgi:hypothetical protein
MPIAKVARSEVSSGAFIGYQRGQAQSGEHSQCYKCSNHDKLTVPNINNIDNTEYQAQPHCSQAINTTKEQPMGQISCQQIENHAFLFCYRGFTYKTSSLNKELLT